MSAEPIREFRSLDVIGINKRVNELIGSISFQFDPEGVLDVFELVL